MTILKIPTKTVSFNYTHYKNKLQIIVNKTILSFTFRKRKQANKHICKEANLSIYKQCTYKAN